LCFVCCSAEQRTKDLRAGRHPAEHGRNHHAEEQPRNVNKSYERTAESQGRHAFNGECGLLAHTLLAQGLSENIVRQIDFTQVDIESQVVQVHDLKDTRNTGHSPVNWCPRDI
jgi:hypothetical protein